MFDPKCNKYPYTLDTSSHYIKIKKDNGMVFDKNYPYIDKTKKFLFKQWLIRVVLFLIVFPLARIRLGLKIKGKKNIRKNKELIKKGVISCSNHIHFWDYIAIIRAIVPYKPYVLSWSYNLRGENSKLVRLVGGIPIPENDVQASFAYLKSIEKLLNDGGWLHIYPEGSMWEFYAPIRPFKRGAAYLACKFNHPIIPMAFSYRKCGWIRRKIFKQIACLTLSIGEPLLANPNLDKKEQELDLTIRLHDSIRNLAGITEEENMYDKVYNNSKRIDYYTNEYGVGNKKYQ